MKEVVFYSVLAVCITSVIITFLHLSFEADAHTANLIVECVYANPDADDPVGKCMVDVPRMLQWKKPEVPR